MSNPNPSLTILKKYLAKHKLSDTIGMLLLSTFVDKQELGPDLSDFLISEEDSFEDEDEDEPFDEEDGWLESPHEKVRYSD